MNRFGGVALSYGIYFGMLGGVLVEIKNLC